MRGSQTLLEFFATNPDTKPTLPNCIPRLFQQALIEGSCHRFEPKMIQERGTEGMQIFHLPNNQSGVYATKEDFCRIFSEEMRGLYLLSLLLTADHQKAEQCFVTGIDRCSEGRPVFNQWARSWTRRIIVQNAVRMISPKAKSIPERSVSPITSVPAHSENQAFLVAITQLPPFERFAFIMSTLERYSDLDCCAFLGCSRRELIDARARAIELLSFHSHLESLDGPKQIEPVAGIGIEPLEAAKSVESA